MLIRHLLGLGIVCLPASLAAQNFSFADARTLFDTYCIKCHQGASAAARLNLARYSSLDTFLASPNTAARILARVRAGEMPPASMPAPDAALREKFTAWLDTNLRTAACADGIAPGATLLRRLNRSEYTATIRDLLNVGVNAGHDLPADGAGGEGFDNAAETLFLSPLHAEKYLEAARQALDYAAQDPRSRKTIIPYEPDTETTPDQAARKVLEAFLPRAFRRPATADETERYLALFQTARKRGDDYDAAILFTLRGVLISPNFLFHMEEPNPNPEPRLANDYELASRLSYFLWGSMPDKTLTDLAAAGTLHNQATLREQTLRLLKDPKALEFAERFVEQWLGTRELGRDIKPDVKLFPAYDDEEVQSAIRYEPVLLFQEILVQNLSLIDLLDANYTFLTNRLARFYGIEAKGLGQLPKRTELPAGSHRGGLLSMAAVLAVSSYPHRTSPVLRGKWVLESILGTPPPPPPPNVPKLNEEHDAAAPKTLREKLEQHRQDPACAVCHNRIDPLGFGLENYDVIGRWRTEDAGKPIDSQGRLPDGSEFNGPEELKNVLLQKKSVFIRNLTTKALAYALGRGLTLEDYCTVDNIVADLEANNYSAQNLITGIVESVPFRYRAGTNPNLPASPPASKEPTQ